ncbi:hypothetical protein [Pseudomonas sp. H9]|uniref:hypothetical protein n=1 Tax=Pseudomonas sp. H9 TaxID=483968 RepID=UPI0010576E7B|nr:hypothetical protein [Pseudomonas sp. H9]TDF84438.1 hypothetical protein E1573_07880 [Pseudomonas sp. H9]
MAGKELTLQPAVVQKRIFSKDALEDTSYLFYVQFLKGNWVDPKLLGELPSKPESGLRPADFHYSSEDQNRLWQVWIDSSIISPTLELEIKYPSDVLKRSDGRGYMFRLAMNWDSKEAGRANNAFSGEMQEKDGLLLLIQSTHQLKLFVKN